jgi:hypothetical protein
MLQNLPDGKAPQENPFQPNLIGSYYLGANLLHDGRYLWLAEQAIKSAADPNIAFSAQPGAEQPLDFNAEPPTSGSCLLYGGSGLPNQVGPLAPDKIVFRDGWNKDDAYLMLNLRFTGWHRYKATNSIVTLDQNGPLIAEDYIGNSFNWLPKGRSIFRDKRIPRENLNGLLISRQGMDEVLYLLTGNGGPWAQNPPFYATVQSFLTGSGLDYARTAIDGWNGWAQTRSIFFYHQGPIVVWDTAQGPTGQAAAVSWHGKGVTQESENRFLLDNGDKKIEMVLLSLDQGKIAAADDDNAGSESILYSSSSDGRLRLATVFLNSEWMGSDVTVDDPNGSPIITIQKGGKQCKIPLREPKAGELSQKCQITK